VDWIARSHDSDAFKQAHRTVHFQAEISRIGSGDFFENVGLPLTPRTTATALSPKCQRRSNRRSELRLMRFMAMAAPMTRRRGSAGTSAKNSGVKMPVPEAMSAMVRLRALESKQQRAQR